MISFALRPNVSLQLAGTGTRLFDSVSGRSLMLSRTEATLIDGAETGTAEPTQVAVLLARLTRAGFVSADPLAWSMLVPNVGPERPTDVVPCLRDGLEVSQRDATLGVIEVKDLASQESFTLFDFEVSIARMLDGKRTVAAVIEAAGRLGITVTVGTLRRFIRQLWAYRLVVFERGRLGGAIRSQPRRAWEPRVRELFRHALRLSRQGQAGEAAQCLEYLQLLDPTNTEAKELARRVELQLRGESPVDVDFEALHGESTLGLARPSAPADFAIDVDDVAFSAPSPAQPVPSLPTIAIPRITLRPPPPPRDALEPPPAPTDVPGLWAKAPERAEAAEEIEPEADEEPVLTRHARFADPEPVSLSEVEGRRIGGSRQALDSARAERNSPPELSAPPPSPADALGLPRTPAPFDASLAPPRPKASVSPVLVPPPLPRRSTAAPTTLTPLPARAQEAEPEVEDASEWTQLWTTLRPARWPFGAKVLVVGLAVGLVAGAGLGLLQPVHQRISTASTLTAKVVTLPEAPRAGSVVTLAVPDGFMVEEGDVLASLETGSVDRHAALLEAARAREKARADAPTPGQQNPALTAKVRAELARAKKDLAALDAKKVTGPARDALEAQVASATAELDALIGGTAQSEARARLKALDEEIAQVADERAHSVIVAPSAGWFVAPAHALGLELAPKATFGVVLSRQATVSVPAPLPAKGVPEVTLVFGSTRVPVREVKVVSTPSGPALKGTAELPGILHPPAAMTSGLPVPVELDYGIRPYWRTLVASRVE